jgi:2-keto-myo-inositol isomerase
MITRRQMIKASSAAFIGGILPLKACAAWPKEKNKERIWPFRIAINTSTISGYKLPVEQQIELCVKAGYEGIELWVRDVQAFIDKGGKVEVVSLKKRLTCSMIWISNSFRAITGKSK